MAQAKHTPGPWYLTEPDRVEAENFGMVCTTRGDFLDAPANARLIAAAPDMLAALEMILPDLETYYYEVNKKSETWADNEQANALMVRLQAARAAIAKAKGEA